MLLRHTPTEVAERKALTVNPAKTCQPIGAMYAALGLSRCLPHSHGSQGCCAYHRSALSRHYKEPVMAATSSFTEGSSVFGGQSNLVASINTIFEVYNPDVIACHSTCLSETIGDDFKQIVDRADKKGSIPEGKKVIYCNTPSYAGSHVTGFSSMVKAFVDFFSESTADKLNQLNIIPGWVEPADMRELKSIAATLGVNIVMFPDTDGVMNAPQTGEHEFYPRGGVTQEALVSSGDSIATLALGPTASTAAAKALDRKCDVPFEVLELPIGLSATDEFVNALRKKGRVKVPQCITDQRGELLDVMTDMHQYFYGKRVALWGDPDQLVPLAEFLTDLDMKPVYIVTGTPGKKFAKRLEDVLDGRVPEAKIAYGAQADMFLMHQWIKNEPVDLLIGNTYGKYIARDENIPFVRHGFPILDRTTHQRFPTLGYSGAIHLLDQILNVFLDKKDRESSEIDFELVL